MSSSARAYSEALERTHDRRAKICEPCEHGSRDDCPGWYWPDIPCPKGLEDEDEQRYFKLGTTRNERLPDIGEEYNYMGIIYKLVDIEPTDQTVHCIDEHGNESDEQMIYMVLVPLRGVELAREEFDQWKSKYFPEYPRR